MKITNLQKTLARSSNKVSVTIIRDDVLKVLFGAEPELDIVTELRTLAENECFELIPGSSLQSWNFKVLKPQSAFEVGKAIIEDLRDKELKVEIQIGTGRFEQLAFSDIDIESFLQPPTNNLDSKNTNDLNEDKFQ